MRAEGEASAACESIMREKRTYRRGGDVVVASTVAAYDPARHPSRSRAPSSSSAFLPARRFVSVARAAPRATAGARSSIPLSRSRASAPLPPLFLRRAQLLALAPAASAGRRQWRGAGERSSDDSPSADCGGRVVRCPGCADVPRCFLSLRADGV